MNIIYKRRIEEHDGNNKFTMNSYEMYNIYLYIYVCERKKEKKKLFKKIILSPKLICTSYILYT